MSHLSLLEVTIYSENLLLSKVDHLGNVLIFLFSSRDSRTIIFFGIICEKENPYFLVNSFMGCHLFKRSLLGGLPVVSYVFNVSYNGFIVNLL